MMWLACCLKGIFRCLHAVGIAYGSECARLILYAIEGMQVVIAALSLAERLTVEEQLHLVGCGNNVLRKF